MPNSAWGARNAKGIWDSPFRELTVFLDWGYNPGRLHGGRDSSIRNQYPIDTALFSVQSLPGIWKVLADASRKPVLFWALFISEGIWELSDGPQMVPEQVGKIPPNLKPQFFFSLVGSIRVSPDFGYSNSFPWLPWEASLISGSRVSYLKNGTSIKMTCSTNHSSLTNIMVLDDGPVPTISWPFCWAWHSWPSTASLSLPLCIQQIVFEDYPLACTVLGVKRYPKFLSHGAYELVRETDKR